VHFAGFVAPEAVEGYMREADVLVVPSLWYENQPLVVLQARALALPLMVSDRGGLPELVEDGSFGRVIEAGNREAWRQALQTVTASPDLVARWKQEALARQAEFNVDDLGRRYLEIVGELIRQPCAS
jgi:glycosyltransferase involved in cell wall biosynthesis